MSRFSVLYYHILKYQPENLKLLQENFDVIELPAPCCDSLDVLGKVDVILAPLGYYLGKDKIEQASKLKVIASNTTGHPHIDVISAREKGIEVITLKDYPEFLKTITPTAELTWGLIVALTRNVIPANKFVMEGKWDRRPFGGAAMLSRMSLGVAGLGRLGTMVASYGKCFGMTVRYYDPFVSNSQLGIARKESLEELVQVSDIITIHIPHLQETENMFNKNIFAHFKKGSYLINTSRGELVDHKALLECLLDGTLAGAAVDVFEGEFEPEFPKRLREHPLYQYAHEHSNLIITPHIGGSTVDAWSLTEEFTIKKVVDFLKEKGA